MPITEMMTLYTEQAGFPLISATRDGARIKVSQRRFFTENSTTENTQRWLVPITVATSEAEFQNTQSRLTLLTPTAQDVPITIGENAPYYVLNVQAFNFHRVNYDLENWEAIKKALKSENFGGIHRLNRAQIVDDLFQLARAGYLSYDFIFDIVNYIKDETDLNPWLAFLNGMNYLQTRIPDEEYRDFFHVSVPTFVLKPLC